ncbi:Pepco domain-containing protein [Streptomyces sp. NPDC055078]
MTGNTIGSDGTPDTLPFWVEATEADLEARRDDTMGLFSRDGETVLRSVPLGPLRRNLADTVDALQTVFEEIAARGGVLPLAEAQLSFQVTAAGSVQLIGSGQLQSARSLTLTFRHPEPSSPSPSPSPSSSPSSSGSGDEPGDSPAPGH